LQKLISAVRASSGGVRRRSCTAEPSKMPRCSGFESTLKATVFRVLAAVAREWAEALLSWRMDIVQRG
jgi:hypothetical protein